MTRVSWHLARSDPRAALGHDFRSLRRGCRNPRGSTGWQSPLSCWAQCRPSSPSAYRTSFEQREIEGSDSFCGW